MSDNPYAAPSETSYVSDIPSVKRKHELARRFTRFASAFIDGLILMAVLVPVMFTTGYMDRARAQQVGVAEQIAMSLLGMAVMLIFNGYFLVTRGQSIGKILTKIQIVDARSGDLLPFLRVYVLRYLWVLPLSIVTLLIPGATDDLLVNLAVLMDLLMIFGGDRKCLHDAIAGSKVVMYQPGRELAI